MRVQAVSMVRSVLRAFVLAVMFLLLVAGGKTSMCALLSVVGLAPHHHVSVSDEPQAQSICLSDDVCLGDQSTVPCTKSCLFHLASATSPTVSNLPVPIVAGAGTPFTLSESLLRIEPASQVHFTSSLPHSTDIRKRLLASPSVTGRFLI